MKKRLLINAGIVLLLIAAIIIIYSISIVQDIPVLEIGLFSIFIVIIDGVIYLNKVNKANKKNK